MSILGIITVSLIISVVVLFGIGTIIDMWQEEKENDR